MERSVIRDRMSRIPLRSMRATDYSELHLWRLVEGLALLAYVEELARRKAEDAGEQGGRELLDAGVVFLHCVVEEAPRRRELVLDIGEFGLQLLEIGVGLEVRVGLGEREQLTQGAREHVLGGRLLRRPLRRHRGVARLRHRFQRGGLAARGTL